MRIDELIYSLFQADAGITALVGTRVYPLLKAQDKEFPAIVYEVIDTDRALNMAGPDGLIQNTVEIYCYGTTYTEARTVFEAVLTYLHGLKGAVFSNGGVATGVHNPSILSLDFVTQVYTLDFGDAVIQGAWILDEEDLYSDDPKRFGVQGDFRMVFCS